MTELVKFGKNRLMTRVSARSRGTDSQPEQNRLPLNHVDSETNVTFVSQMSYVPLRLYLRLRLNSIGSFPIFVGFQMEVV